MQNLLASTLLAAALWAGPFAFMMWREPPPLPGVHESGAVLGRDPHTAYGNSRSEAFPAILRNNLGVVLLNITGFATFGATTAATLLLNGAVFGHIVKQQVTRGMPAGRIAGLILPHGVPELIGLWLSGGVGFRGSGILVELLQGRPGPPLAAMAGFLSAAVISCGIILVAAWIEAFITLRPLLP